jgi:hypothetical protein
LVSPQVKPIGFINDAVSAKLNELPAKEIPAKRASRIVKNFAIVFIIASEVSNA